MFEYWSKMGKKSWGHQKTLYIPNVELFLDFRAYCYVILEERVKNSLEICSIHSCVIYFFFFSKKGGGQLRF